jgi:hypothetical protein
MTTGSVRIDTGKLIKLAKRWRRDCKVSIKDKVIKVFLFWVQISSDSRLLKEVGNLVGILFVIDMIIKLNTKIIFQPNCFHLSESSKLSNCILLFTCHNSKNSVYSSFYNACAKTNRGEPYLILRLVS